MRAVGGLKKLKRPKVFGPLLIITLLIIGAALIIKNLNAPAVGSVNQTPPAQSVPTDPYAQPGTYNGKYVSFKYPPHFKQISSTLNGSALEIVNYHSTDLAGKQISIGVYRSNIASSGDVQYRREHPELYKENDSRLGVEFTKTDGTEDTFFLEHNGLLASVSATAPSGGLAGEAFFVASGLKWL